MNCWGARPLPVRTLRSVAAAASTVYIACRMSTANGSGNATKQEAMRILGAAGVPAGAVLDTQELHDEESFGRRGIMQVMQHPACGAFKFKMPTWPVRHDGATPTLRPAPQLGQRTDMCLATGLA